MKKIIGGKIYNTDTAEKVCCSEYSNPSDFHYCIERLYRTKKGAWFVHGEGGPMSKYAVHDGDNLEEMIKDLTPQQRRQLVEIVKAMKGM